MRSNFHKLSRLLTVLLIGISFALTTTSCSPGPYWDYYSYDSGYHKGHHKKHKPKKPKKPKKHKKHHHDDD
ncbi:MAG: hypothetical protein K2G52_07810 [Muribaculaceae bacterium]|nr:hypothetical protein [Muribaculaceae bacterium]